MRGAPRMEQRRLERVKVLEYLDRIRENPVDPKDCRAMWAAALIQALRDIEPLVQHREPDVYRDTVAWFDNDEHELQSFVWICDTLELNPDAVREKTFRGLPLQGRRRRNRCD